jgi:AhpD family alkylhydroperoxidase
MLDLDSKTYRAFIEMANAAFSDGALSKRVKELMAVAISVVVNCEHCMEWHVNAAASAGATYDEVLEAVEVGMEMGGGPATAHARFALEVMDIAFDT